MKKFDLLAGIVEFSTFVGYDYHDGDCRRGFKSKYTLLLDNEIIEWESVESYVSPQEIIDKVLQAINKEENPLDWQWTKGWINRVSSTSKERSGRYGWSLTENQTYEVFVS